MDRAVHLIDTGGPDDNVPLDALSRDPDPRYRPSPELLGAVAEAGYGCLDRPTVPLLNALVSRGVRTLESCAGGMLFAGGVERRTVEALQRVRRPWMQMRWTVATDADAPHRWARTELWWSRRIVNWGGYMGIDSDWRWRSRTRSKRCVDGALLIAAAEIDSAPLPAPGMPSDEGDWLTHVLGSLVPGPDALDGAGWFEVVLTRDSQGWSVTARREYTPTGTLASRSLPALRRSVDACPRRLLSGEGTAGLVELRAALARCGERRPWSQLDGAQREAMRAAYAIAPSEHARAGPAR